MSRLKSVSGPQNASFERCRTFDLMMAVHTRAPFRLVREAAPYFRNKDPEKQKQNRSIINVSSVSGL